MTEYEEKRTAEMARDAAARLVRWIKGEDTTVTPQVSLDLGIVIGRLIHLEKRRQPVKE